MQKLSDRAVVFVKPYVRQGLAKSRATQIPFQAHTSANAKLGIGASLFVGILALTGVAALFGHGIAKRTSPEYRKASDKAFKKLESKANKAAKDAKKTVKKIANDAQKVAEDKADDVKSTARTARAKVDQTVDKASE